MKNLTLIVSIVLLISVSIDCDRLKPMLNGGKMGTGLGAYPGKFGARSSNLANNHGGFGATNQYGGFGTSNMYGGFGNNGMAQLHQLRMGMGALPGRFSQNLASQNHQAIQNHAIPAAGGYPLKFGKRLGLGASYGK